MAAETDLSARPRAPLSRERVLSAALALADTGGIGSLTMRRLGQELGVEAMSLYNHVAGKEDVLDGIADLVYGEIVVPTAAPDREVADWRAAMRQRAISAREVLMRHPWASGVMQSRTRPGPATLRHHDAVIGTLRRAGFTVEMAAHAFSVMDSFIYGFAQQQDNLIYSAPDEAPVVAESILSGVPAGEYPDLAEMITEHVMTPGYNYAEEFDFGLDLILDGLERLKRADDRIR